MSLGCFLTLDKTLLCSLKFLLTYVNYTQWWISWGSRDGSVRSTCCSSWGPGWMEAYNHPSLWFLEIHCPLLTSKAPGLHMAHTHSYRQDTHSHKITKSKRLLGFTITLLHTYTMHFDHTPRTFSFPLSLPPSTLSVFYFHVFLFGCFPCFGDPVSFIRIIYWIILGTSPVATQLQKEMPHPPVANIKIFAQPSLLRQGLTT